MASYQYIYVMRRLTKVFPGGRQVLRDITLAFLPGAKIGVLGLNGAGKSTLLRIMAGLETDIDGEGRTAYLVMELVNGEPLNSVLKRTGRLSLRHALDMLEQTGRALQVAHTAGLVHRDVKPENIMVVQTKRGILCKLTDFGIAGVVADGGERLTQTGMVHGSPGYMSPEQASGARELDGRTDLYALGVIRSEDVG